MLRRPAGVCSEHSKRIISPVVLSLPTTSGSPPERSISWRDQSTAFFAVRRASTAAHSRPAWRSGWARKRASSFLSNASRCFGLSSLAFGIPLSLYEDRLGGYHFNAQRDGPPNAPGPVHDPGGYRDRLVRAQGDD